MKMQISRRSGALATLFAIAVMGGVGSLLWKKSDFSQNTSASISVPHFELQDDHLQQRSLKEFEGQVLIVHFWATWCEPCVTEIPALLQFVKSLQGLAVKVIVISLDENWEDAFRVLPKQAVPANMVSLIDPTLSVARNFGSFEYPESYLVDRKGKIFRKWVGPQRWGDARFREAVDLLL